MNAHDVKPYPLLREQARSHRITHELEMGTTPVGAGLPANRPSPHTEISQAEQLTDLAVAALIDEADLSPKPGLVDRRTSGYHTHMTLPLTHA